MSIKKTVQITFGNVLVFHYLILHKISMYRRIIATIYTVQVLYILKLLTFKIEYAYAIEFKRHDHYKLNVI